MNCDRIARWYRWMEYAAFGGALRKRREAFLFELGNPQRVLVLGDGDGRFLQLFVALYPEARVDAVDVSAKMIELAERRVGDRVQFHCADAREFGYDGPYDLAVAHFFFDCFEQGELASLVARIPTKSWLISEFRYTGWSRPMIRGLYFFFRVSTGLRVTSVADYRAILKPAGFQLEKEQAGLAGTVASELWARE